MFKIAEEETEIHEILGTLTSERKTAYSLMNLRTAQILEVVTPLLMKIRETKEKVRIQVIVVEDKPEVEPQSKMPDPDTTRSVIQDGSISNEKILIQDGSITNERISDLDVDQEQTADRSVIKAEQRNLITASTIPTKSLPMAEPIKTKPSLFNRVWNWIFA